MDELDQFKRADLRHYAASVGYVIDRRESSAGSSVMRRDHDKVIISRKPDGHYIYWSPRDESDHGTIIDFVQKRKGANLGEVRKLLRAWLGEPQPPLPSLPRLVETTKHLALVQTRYAAMRTATRHAYLETARAIPVEILQHRRFAGRIKIDRYGAAAFPHVDDTNTICGYELKNTNGFTGFASGGKKGLFISNTCASDRRLVLTESGVDALSYAAIFGDLETARYGSIGGKPTPAQSGVVRSAIAALPGGSEVVAATDADKAGDELAEGIKSMFDDCRRADLTFRRERPVGRKDWNDILRGSPTAATKKHLCPCLLPKQRHLPYEAQLTDCSSGGRYECCAADRYDGVPFLLQRSEAVDSLNQSQSEMHLLRRSLRGVDRSRSRRLHSDRGRLFRHENRLRNRLETRRHHVQDRGSTHAPERIGTGGRTR